MCVSCMKELQEMKRGSEFEGYEEYPCGAEKIYSIKKD